MEDDNCYLEIVIFAPLRLVLRAPIVRLFIRLHSTKGATRRLGIWTRIGAGAQPELYKDVRGTHRVTLASLDTCHGAESAQEPNFDSLANFFTCFYTNFKPRRRGQASLLFLFSPDRQLESRKDPR